MALSRIVPAIARRGPGCVGAGGDAGCAPPDLPAAILTASADTDLPLAREIAYDDPLRLFAPWAEQPYAMLLDSAAAGLGQGLHSFICVDPFQVLESRDGAISCGGRRRAGDPFAALRGELARFAQPSLPGLPPLQGGAVGYLGYELARHLERLPAAALEDGGLPDLVLGFYDCVVAFDHPARRAWIVSTGHPAPAGPERRARAAARLAALAARLAAAPALPEPAPPGAAPALASNFSEAGYRAAVQRVIDYILAGDIFQANLSQRFVAPLPDGLSEWDLYRRLRRRNPAAFAAFLRLPGGAIASASPERFLRLAGDAVETWPIKGTRRRGRDAAEDRALAAELAGSEKDRAENVMIVDLLRNDLSRVCRDGSIQVPSLCRLETLPTVFHLVSMVTGRLRPGLGAVDLLAACFPGGSITGAPKIRAMEIIAELEPTRRGPYCGAIGWLGFDGAMDSSIVIRTFAIRDRVVRFQAGGGIVADSRPDAEYEETLAKARALIDALSPP
jgi:para-aminobenzoate synthetase component 1